MRHIYLDYAATTPTDKDVVKAMSKYFTNKNGLFGNPNSIHYFGQRAMLAVDNSREAIAKEFGASFDELFFTGSATESNNLIIRGALHGYYRNFNNRRIPRILVSSIEHSSVLETVRDLEKNGLADISYIPVDKDGVVDIEFLKNEINDRTILVSVMMVNNEVGSVQPIKEIAEIVFRHKKNLSGNNLYPIFHSDAVQGVLLNKINVLDFGIDSMTVSAHKIYGPKGIGALYMKKNVQDYVSSIITGGGQESGMRSGTQNTPYIVGFAKAIEIASTKRKEEHDRLKKLSDRLFDEVKRILPEIDMNGSNKNRSPHILNLFVPYDDVSTKLDIDGVAVSAGSACAQGLIKPSHVLKSMGFGADRIRRSFRISFGRTTTKKDIEIAIKKIIISTGKYKKENEIPWCKED